MLSNKLEFWIKLIESIDFGLASVSPKKEESMLYILEHVAYEMENLGFDTTKIKLAIRFFKTDPEKAKAILFGQAPVGDGINVLTELKNFLRYSVLYKGSIYTPIN